MPLPATSVTHKRSADHEVDNPKTKQLKAFQVVDASTTTDQSSTEDAPDSNNNSNNESDEIDYDEIKELLTLARQVTRYVLAFDAYYPEADSHAKSEALATSDNQAMKQAQKVYKKLKRLSRHVFSKQISMLSPDQLSSLPISTEECVNICWQINLGYMSQILWISDDDLPISRSKYGNFLIELAENLKQVASFMDVTSFPELVEVVISVKIQAIAVWFDKRRNMKLIKEMFHQDEDQSSELNSDDNDNDNDVEWMREFKRALKEKQENIYNVLTEMSLNEIREKFSYKEFQDALKDFMYSMASYLQSTLSELQNENTVVVSPQVIGAIYRDYPDDLDRTLDRIRMTTPTHSTSSIIHTSFVELMETKQQASDTNESSHDRASTSSTHITKKRYIHDRDETATRMQWSDDDDEEDNEDEEEDNVSAASSKQTEAAIVTNNALALIQDEYHDMSKQFDSFVEEQSTTSESTDASKRSKSPLPSANQVVSNTHTESVQNKREALRSTHINQQVDGEEYESELSVISKESSEDDAESNASSYKTAKSTDMEETETETAQAQASSTSSTSQEPSNNQENNQENEQVNDTPPTVHVPVFARAQKRRPWTDEETNTLIKGMNELGICWRAICNKYGKENGPLAGRTNVQLKDKARNIRLYRLRHNIDLGIFALLGPDPSK